MKSASLMLIILQLACAHALAADDASIERMATCKDSWLDWEKNDPGQLKKFGDHFQSEFARNGNDPFFVPRSGISIAGLRVTQLFPDSLGMGVGFSVTVDATFEKAKRSLETTLGKPLEKCEVGDDMRTCALEIGEKRTFMLMAASNAKANTTLLGCYYYYEK
jgi:hypothetical protein